MSQQTVWVLHACGRLSIGGVQAMLMNYYKAIDRDSVQFAFAVQRDYPMEYDALIQEMGGRIHYLSRMDENLFSYINDLGSIIKNHPEYKIIHCHLNRKNAIPLWVAKRKGIRVRISHSHNITPEKISVTQKIRNIVMRHMVSRLATEKVGCSINANEDLYPHDNSAIVIKNAIDLNKFSYCENKRVTIRSEYGVSKDTILLGHVGNFTKQKNPFFLVDILYELPNQYKLMMVGGGNQKKQVEKYAITKGVKDRVIFTGIIDSSVMFQSMDIFLLPSLYEGLGIVAIEAMTSGLPVICSNNVPREIDIVSDCYHLSVSDGIYPWVNKIKEIVPFQRINNIQKIREAGYDIEQEGMRLTKYYLGLNDKEYEKKTD